MADTPDFPDTNCTMLIDPEGRLWLIWPTIIANLWESALLKYRISSEYHHDGSPRWNVSEVLHIKPGPEFEVEVNKRMPAFQGLLSSTKLQESDRREVEEFLGAMSKNSTNKLYRRLGWMTRAHPVVLNSQRLIVPLYHDGFSFSLMAISDNWGATWHVSTPLVGGGNIQPSIVQKKDGSLFTLMRDNGPPPKRLLQSESFDQGETWTAVTDSQLPNPGSGAELIALRNGHWALVANDTEQGRHSLIIQISDDEGRTWKWKRHLDSDPSGEEAGAYHYPSVIESRDGSLHVTYSYHLNRRNLPRDVDGDPAGKSIKHAHFNEAWVKKGDTSYLN